MLGIKLQKLIIYALPFFMFAGTGLSAEDSSGGSTTEMSKAETIASRFAIHGGFGFMRAFKTPTTHDLGANGFADVKVSYRTHFEPREKKVYATARYFPFQISPMSDDSSQQFSGIASAYVVGGEINFFTKNKFELYSSLELGAYQAHLAELIPQTKADRPIKSFGSLIIAGVEMRYKVYEKFHIGPRIYLGTGSISIASFLLGASFYF